MKASGSGGLKAWPSLRVRCSQIAEQQAEVEARVSRAGDGAAAGTAAATPQTTGELGRAAP